MAGTSDRHARRQAEADRKQLEEDAKRMGISPRRLMSQRANSAKAREGRLPERHDQNAEIVADVMTDGSPMLEPIRKAAERVGLSPAIVKGLLERMETEYLPLSKALRDVQSDTMERLFGNAAEHILRSITADDIAKASLKDKMIAAGIAIDKRNLLRGLPTERISIEDRESLRELLPHIVREARRRRVTIDVTPGSKPDVHRDVSYNEARALDTLEALPDEVIG